MANKYVTLSNLSTFKTNLDARMQAKLSTSNVNQGTLAQSLGFDSSGNLVRGNASGGSGITNYEVIEQEVSLPTATTISPDFIQVSGVLYQKKASGSPAVYSYEEVDQKELPTVSSSVYDRYLHTNSLTGTLEWSQLSVPNVVQDLTSNVNPAGSLDQTAWGTLKTAHTVTIASPDMTGLDASYEFINIRLSVYNTTQSGQVDQYVKLSKNINVSTPSSIVRYSGLFFIEESTNLYEITAYYNGTNIILRCATVK